VGPSNQALDGSRDWTNSLVAARGDKTAMRPFVELLWTLANLRTDYKTMSVSHSIAPCGPRGGNATWFIFLFWRYINGLFVCLLNLLP